MNRTEKFPVRVHLGLMGQKDNKQADKKITDTLNEGREGNMIH